MKCNVEVDEIQAHSAKIVEEKMYVRLGFVKTSGSLQSHHLVGGWTNQRPLVKK